MKKIITILLSLIAVVISKYYSRIGYVYGFRNFFQDFEGFKLSSILLGFIILSLVGSGISLSYQVKEIGLDKWTLISGIILTGSLVYSLSSILTGVVFFGILALFVKIALD